MMKQRVPEVQTHFPKSVLAAMAVGGVGASVGRSGWRYENSRHHVGQRQLERKVIPQGRHLWEGCSDRTGPAPMPGLEGQG